MREKWLVIHSILYVMHANPNTNPFILIYLIGVLLMTLFMTQLEKISAKKDTSVINGSIVNLCVTHVQLINTVINRLNSL